MVTKVLSSHILALSFVLAAMGCGTHHAQTSLSTTDVVKDGTDVDASAASQTAPSQAFLNGTFEASSLLGWEVEGFESAGLNRVPPASIADLALASPDANTTTARLTGQAQSIVPQALTGANSLRVPYKGDGCAWVNTQGNQKAAAKIAQTVTVGLADVDPLDAKVHVRAVWAPTLAIAPHTPDEQPFTFWQLERLDGTPRVLSTLTTLSDQMGVLWQTDNPNVLYTPWQLLDVALGPDIINVGDTVRLTGLASGCAKGAHAGQMYVDNVGTQASSVILRVDGPTVARPNQNLSYALSVTNGNANDAMGVTVVATIPDDTTFFALAGAQNATCSTPAMGEQGNIICHWPTFVGLGSETMTLSVVNQAPAGSTVTMGKAVIMAIGQAELLAMRVDTAIASVGSLCDLQVRVAKASSEITLDANGAPEHLLDVDITNQGPQSVDDAKVTAYLPAGLTPISWQCQALHGASCAGATTTTAVGNLDTNAALPLGASLSCTVKIAAHPTRDANLAVPYGVVATPPVGVTDPYRYNSSAGVMIDLTMGYGLPNGATCATASDCNSLFCVDGVCCNTSCLAQCMACDNVGKLGQCTEVVLGAPHSTRASCSPFVCVDGNCASSCQEQKDCALGYYCTPEKTCEAANSQDGNVVLWRLQGSGCQASGSQHLSQGVAVLFVLAVLGLLRKHRARSWVWLWLGITLLGLSHRTTAWAQAADQHINIDLLRPMGGIYDVGYVQAARLPALDALKAGVLASYADSPLRLVSTRNSHASTPIVGNQTALDVGLALAMWQRAELSAVLPLIAQSLHAAPYVSTNLKPPGDTYTLGDLRIVPKMLLANLGDLSLSISVPISIPTAKGEYVSLAAIAYMPRLLIEYCRSTIFHGIVNIGANLQPARRLFGIDAYNSLTGSVALLYPIASSLGAWDVGIMGQGEYALGDARRLASPAIADVIGQWQSTFGLGLSLAAGMGLNSGAGAPMWRAMFGIHYQHDAPWAQPKEQSKTKTIAAPPQLPLVVDPPLSPIAPIVHKDSDGDGVLDEDDRCPHVPGSPNSVMPGCPEAPKAIREGLEKIRMTHFAVRSSDIQPADLPTLQQVDELMKARLTLRIRIEGHTDNKGSKKENIRLAHARANKVKAWLVTRGVDAHRIITAGLASKHPLASNATAGGRAINRRVVFRVMSAERRNKGP